MNKATSIPLQSCLLLGLPRLPHPPRSCGDSLSDLAAPCTLALSPSFSPTHIWPVLRSRGSIDGHVSSIGFMIATPEHIVLSQEYHHCLQFRQEPSACTELLQMHISQLRSSRVTHLSQDQRTVLLYVFLWTSLTPALCQSHEFCPVGPSLRDKKMNTVPNKVRHPNR